MSNRVFGGAGLLIVCAAVGFCEVAAQTEPSVATFRDWQVVADGEAGSCLLLQDVLGRSTGTNLLQAILRPEQDGSATLMVSVPNGVSLVDGIAYRHTTASDSGIGLTWQSCSADTCSAATRISEDEFGLLRRGQTVSFGYRPLPTSRTINVPLSLAGLTAAWRAAETCS